MARRAGKYLLAVGNLCDDEKKILFVCRERAGISERRIGGENQNI